MKSSVLVALSLTLCALSTLPAQVENLKSLKAGEDLPAKFLMQQKGLEAGLVVFVEPTGLQSAIELAKTGRYVVATFFRDLERVREADAAFAAAGVHPGADAVLWLEPGKTLPFRDRSVNAVIGDHQGMITAEEVDRLIAPGYGVGFVRTGSDWTERRVKRPEGMDVWMGRMSGPEGHAGSEDTVVVPPNTIQYVTGPRTIPFNTTAQSAISERFWVNGVHAKDAFTGVTLATVPETERDYSFIHNEILFDLVGKFGGGSHLRAVQLSTGELLWSVEVDIGTGSPSASAHSPQLISHDGQSIFVTDGTNKLRAFDMKTGNRLWAQELDHAIGMLACDGTTLVATLIKAYDFPLEVSYAYSVNIGKAVIRIDRATGKEIWRNEVVKDKPVAHLAVGYGAVVSSGYIVPMNYVPNGSSTRRQIARTKTMMHFELLEPDTGKVRVFRENFHEFRQSGGRSNIGQTMGIIPGYAVLQTDKEAAFFNLENGELDRVLTDGTYNHANNQATTPNYHFYLNRGVPLDQNGMISNFANRFNGIAYYRGYKPANGMLYASAGGPETAIYHTDYRGYMPMIYRESFGPLFEDSRRLIVRGTASGYAEPDPTQWYSFRGNHERRGWIDVPAPAGLSLAWEKKLSLPQLPDHSPVAAGWNANADLPGPISQPSSDGKLVLISVPNAHRIDALDLQTGNIVWSTILGGRADTAPTIGGQVAYVGTHDGMVTALNMKDGAVIWQFFAAATDEVLLSHDQIESFYYVPSSPVLHNGRLYVNAGRHTALEHGVMVWALDPRTGDILGKSQFDLTAASARFGASGKSGTGFVNDTLQLVDGELRVNHVLLTAENGRIRSDLTWGGTQRMSVYPEFNASIKVGGLGWIRPENQWKPWSAGPYAIYKTRIGAIHRDQDLVTFDKTGSFERTTRADIEAAGKKGVGTAFKMKLQGAVRPSDEGMKAMIGAGGVFYSAYRSFEQNELVLLVAYADGTTESVGVPAVSKREMIIPDSLAVAAGKVLVCTTAGRVLCFQAANFAPQASDERLTVSADKASVLDVLANDQDHDGDPLTIAGVQVKPQRGTVAVKSDRTLIYTPKPGFVGSDRLVYLVSDGKGALHEGVVDVIVQSGNSTEDHDHFEGHEGKHLAGWSDLQGQYMYKQQDGKLQWLPHHTARVAPDSVLLRDTVVSGNEFTAAVDLSFAKSKGGDKEIHLYVGYHDEENWHRVLLMDGQVRLQQKVEGVLTDLSEPVGSSAGGKKAVRWSIVAGGGRLTFSENGTVLATANSVFPSRPSRVGLGNRNQRPVWDNFHLTSTAGFVSASTPMNDVVSTVMNEPVQIKALQNDVGVTGVTSMTQPSSGKAFRYSDGRLAYVPKPGYTGHDRFTYTVTDGNGASATAEVRITVESANQPTVAVDDHFEVQAGQALEMNLIANDRDPDGQNVRFGDILRRPANGTVVRIQSKRKTHDVLYNPKPGFVGTDSFTYAVGDGQNANTAAVGTVHVTVVAAGNVPPEAVDDKRGMKPGESLIVPVLDNDSDVNKADYLKISSVTAAKNGTAVIEFNTIRYTPKPGFEGEDQFQYTVSDGNGGTAVATATVKVSASYLTEEEKREQIQMQREARRKKKK